MSIKKEPQLSSSALLQSFVGRRAVSAADDRQVRRIDAGIFAELLPSITKRLAHRRPLVHMSKEPQSDGAFMLNDSSVLPLHTPALRVRKESFPMQAYLTVSPYYFSSKQLLPAGSLVFFSEKIKRYVHPTDGVLLDGHPRLQVLSEAESQALEDRWRDALARYKEDAVLHKT